MKWYNWYFEVLKKYAVFSGRAQRAEYWYFTLFNLIFLFVLTKLDMAIGTYIAESEAGLLSGIYAIALIVPSLAVAVRRLHDTGKSGWWYFIILIPIIGAIAMFVFLIQDSTEDNRYGKNPKAKNNHNEEIINEMEKMIDE